MRSPFKYLLILLAAVALLGLVAARPIASLVGPRVGPLILKATKGKVADPTAFVSGRVADGSLLLGVAVLLCAPLWLASRTTARRPNAWIHLSLAAFVAVNVWVLVAMQTTLYWAGLFTGSSTAVLTQFSFKKTLLNEHPAKRQILLMGSSQTQSQIDESILNAELGSNTWTTELHFPGSRSLDLLLTLRRLRGAPGGEIVCYLSEFYFYPGLYASAAPYFLSVADLPLLRRIGLGSELFDKQFGYGLVGEALPLFRCREPLTDRFLGPSISSFAQAKHNAALETNLVRRAEEWAKPFKLDEHAEIQKRAFRAFVEEAGRQHRQLLLIEGQVNPLLAERLPEELRRDMKNFLRAIAAENSHVTLIPEEQLPPQPAAAYHDLTHVNADAQKEFSLWLANWLQRVRTRAAELDLRENPAAGRFELL